MLWGLTSALGFGFADLLGAVSTKRIGVPVTLFVIQSVDVVLLSILLLTPIPGPIDATGPALVAIGVSGLLGTISFFAFYRALQLGPVAIVSPVFASYATITVVLSVGVDGEHLSSLAISGIAVTITGVVLASGRSLRGATDPSRWGGIPFALVATMAWGVASYLVGRYAQRVGWFLPLYGSRLVEFLFVGIALMVLRFLGGSLPLPRGGSLLVPALSGLADNLGVAAFARGSQVGLVSITSAVSASFPLVVIAGGLMVFHERPTRWQWVGVLMAIAGLVMLGLGR